jgi:hypothetical protein
MMMMVVVVVVDDLRSATIAHCVSARPECLWRERGGEIRSIVCVAEWYTTIYSGTATPRGYSYVQTTLVSSSLDDTYVEVPLHTSINVLGTS